MATVTPPKTIDEIPQKLLEAWVSLGAELSDDDQRLFDLAVTSDWGYIHNRFAKAIIAASPSAPADSLPDWEPAIVELLVSRPDNPKFVCAALTYFLSSATLCRPEFAAVRNQSKLPNFLPRNREERTQLAELATSCDDLSSRRDALELMARNPRNEERDMTEEQIDQLLQETLRALSDKSLNLPRSEREYRDVCRRVKDPVLLVDLMERGSSHLRRAALNRYQYGDLEGVGEGGLRWTGLLDLISRHPKDFVAAGIYEFDLDVVEVIWEKGATETSRAFALQRLLQLIDAEYALDDDDTPVAHDTAKYFDCLKRYWQQESELVRKYVTNEYALDDLSYGSLYRMLKLADPAVGARVLSVTVQKLENESYCDDDEGEDTESKKQEKELRALLRDVLPSQIEKLNDFAPAEVARLTPYIVDDKTISAVAEVMQGFAARSKPVRTKLPLGLANATPKVLEDTGWLTDKRKAVRGVALEALLLNESADAVPYLKQIHEDKKTTDADKDRIADRLQDLGAADGLTPPMELTQEELLEKASKAKIKPQIAKLWSNELASAFAPLDESIAKWLLTMVFESKDDKLPRTVTTALASLSTERKAQLAEHMVQLWLRNNGDAKSRWMMKFVPGLADDRIVDPLFKGFQGWYKRAKPKAVYVLETMGVLDSKYALSQVQIVYGKNTYSYALQEGAKKTLLAAAKRRKVELLDLFDELTPDFGMGPDGLVVDVGPYNYVITIAGDLSLRVRNDATDKVTKSFPKVKKDEDADKHASGDAQFKFLRSNLKKVAKQQSKQLLEAMVSMRSWPFARWKVVFQEHPLLGLLGQSMIWRTQSGQSFRISEDQSLISVTDDAIELAEDDKVSIWHPALCSVEETAAWSAHLDDYEIKPLLDQVNQPRADLSDDELKSDVLARFADIKVEQYIVQRYMNSWNYDQHDGDGSWIASYYRKFQLAGIAVVLELDDMRMFGMEGDTATIQRFEFFSNRKQLKLADVPAPLIATIIGHGQALKAQAVTD